MHLNQTKKKYYYVQNLNPIIEVFSHITELAYSKSNGLIIFFNYLFRAPTIVNNFYLIQKSAVSSAVSLVLSKKDFTFNNYASEALNVNITLWD